MSAVLGAEGSASTLPVTGSGPFSILVALIGVISVAFGGLLRRIGSRRT